MDCPDGDAKVFLARCQPAARDLTEAESAQDADEQTHHSRHQAVQLCSQAVATTKVFQRCRIVNFVP